MKKKIFTRQGYHLIVYLILGGLLYRAVGSFPEAQNQLWGLSAAQWIFLSWALAGLHQGWVWFFWRLELYGGKISAWMGKAGFLLYRIGFVSWALSRLLIVIPVSLATPKTLAVPPAVGIPFLVISTVLGLWGLYSVVAYFGVTRAFGADHFDPAYREGTLEKRGTFKYIPNSMYTVVLPLLYQPGVVFGSRLGLILAAAQHAFVWTHYFCTEKPDMKEIYGVKTQERQDARA